LVAPPGQGTRPTADRVRQALFDMLMHAEWGGRAVVEGAVVLDVFAGTGALGLEALSRGAASACFIERDAAALRALRANVAACKAEGRVKVVAMDVLSAFGARRMGCAVRTHYNDDENVGLAAVASLVFLDPPYGQNLVCRALDHLREIHCIAPGALIVAEVGQDETGLPNYNLLAERQHGAARLLIFRAS
jgi:16S rRNA (guanine966-N2)-methyltransferase